MCIRRVVVLDKIRYLRDASSNVGSFKFCSKYLYHHKKNCLSRTWSCIGKSLSLYFSLILEELQTYPSIIIYICRRRLSLQLNIFFPNKSFENLNFKCLELGVSATELVSVAMYEVNSHSPNHASLTLFLLFLSYKQILMGFWCHIPSPSRWDTETQMKWETSLNPVCLTSEEPYNNTRAIVSILKISSTHVFT